MSSDQIHETMENARETLVEPYFKLSLEDTHRQQLSELKGDVVREGNKESVKASLAA